MVDIKKGRTLSDPAPSPSTTTAKHHQDGYTHHSSHGADTQVDLKLVGPDAVLWARATCSIDNCDRPAHARGWCPAHYQRWRRYGDPLLGDRPDVTKRLWEKVQFNDGCWLFTGSANTNGYGLISVNNSRQLAHRVAYELLVGPIPAAMVLDHVCHQTRCVKPDHLRPVTQKQNMENHSGPTARNTSGVRGVYWAAHAGMWRARVKHNGRDFHVGYFKSLDTAAEAVKAKRNELFTYNDADREVSMRATHYVS